MEDMHDLLQERARASQARLLELHGGIALDAWESLLDRVENELAREGEKKEGAKRDEGSDGDEGDLRSVTEQTMGGSARHVTVGTLVAAAVGLLRHGAVCRPALP